MESAFQFSNPSLTKMEFCINEDFENSWDKEVKIAVNMGIPVSYTHLTLPTTERV